MRTTVTRGKRLWAVFSLSLLAVSASAQLSWTFDSGALSWQVVNVDASSMSQSGSASSPIWTGSEILAISESSNDPIYTFFQAPVTSGIGLQDATLAFSLTTPAGTHENAVVIAGNGLFAVAPVAAPSAKWSPYTIVLDAGNFFTDLNFSQHIGTTEFASILSNLDAFLLPADFGGGGSSSTVTSLDNVSIVAIPEPATTAAMLGGAALLAVGFARYRRKR